MRHHGRVEQLCKSPCGGIAGCWYQRLPLQHACSRRGGFSHRGPFTVDGYTWLLFIPQATPSNNGKIRRTAEIFSPKTAVCLCCRSAYDNVFSRRDGIPL